MSRDASNLTDSRISVLFKGGPHDGERCCGDSLSEGESNNARVYYKLTEGGRLGSRLYLLSSIKRPALEVPADPAQHHAYDVVSASPEAESITITMEYAGAVPYEPPPKPLH